MYKIFVDTNIVLDFYRIDNKKSINDILKEIKKYKKYFVSTQQSKDEFLRNRERTIRDFVEEIKAQTYKAHNNSIVSTLSEYEEYAQSIAKANSNTKIIIDEINKLKENPEIDLIYKIFLNLNEVIYKRTSEIIERASKRKVTGNPPTSNKYTCGDEIIWETLLEYCDSNLVIVSKDSTFKDNYQFLSTEFYEKSGRKLKIVDTISKAIELNNELPPKELAQVESDIIVEDDLKLYGELQENSNWANIIYNALLTLGNEAELNDIYITAQKIIKEKYPEKIENKEIEATIRGILQRYSSDSKHFNGKNDLFIQLKRGRWGIRKKK